MKIRMLVLALLAVTAVAAIAGEGKKKDGGGAGNGASTAKPTTKVRTPQYVLETKAGSIAIYGGGDEPADPDAVEAGDNEGEVTYVGKNGIVQRAYTQQHLQKIRETFGDQVGDLAQNAHDAGGRKRITDALNLKRSLLIIGTPDEAADEVVKDYLEGANGKKRDAALEDALAENGLIPPGLKGTGRTLGNLLDLVRDHAILGGKDPTKGLTPGVVKGMDDYKNGRISFGDFMNQFGNAIAEDSDDAVDPNESPSDPDDTGDDGAGDDDLGGGFLQDTTDTERDDDPAPQDDDQGSTDQGGNAPDQDGTDPDADEGATYTVDSVTENDDGTTSYVFHVEGSDGDDGSYTTTYFDDGTYVTTDNETGEVVGEGTGTPPDNVQPGDSTTTTQGDEAIFATDDEEEGDGEGDDEGEGEGTDTPSTEMEGCPDGEEHAPLPDDVASLVDAMLRADIAKLKGNGGGASDDDECPGDGKHVTPRQKNVISVAEAAAIENARKLKMIGNPEGIEQHGGRPPKEMPQHDDGVIDYGPDHVDPREGSGVSRVDPRGTKKIGAGHRNDSPAPTASGSGGGFGGGSSSGSSSSSSDSGSSKSKSKSSVRKIGAAKDVKKADSKTNKIQQSALTPKAK